MTYKASVIIPVYNAENTIQKCVESLLYGKERNIQVILVDDCSKDNSWSVCKHLAAQYENVTAVQNEKNSGVSYTRNHGLQVASGEYVLFMDSDDWCSGEFADKMIKTAQISPNQLVICGFHFIDNLNSESREYLWGDADTYTFDVQKEQYFYLVSKILIQFVWNKIFRLDVIRRYNLAFDINQSMGEDFQFVLDYMKVSHIESCLVINQPLYYYVRANNNSLMSKMGLSGYEKSLNRLTQLSELSGQQNSKEYRIQIENLQKNYQYQIVHAKEISRKEKLQRIENVTHDGKAEHHYWIQRASMTRENFAKVKNNLILFQKRTFGWIQRKKRAQLVTKMAEKLKCNDFTIISQNCIGGVFYHDMGLKFQSPTINLYFRAADFVKFVLNLKEYLSMPLIMSWGEKYPIGRLGDIKIYFMHYQTCTEAIDAWEKRKKRVQWDKIVVLSTDREGFNDEVYRQWNMISYPKVLFTSQKKYTKNSDFIYYPEYESSGFVLDLIPDREFYKDGIMVNTINKLG